jgi:hypothetical protein
MKHRSKNSTEKGAGKTAAIPFRLTPERRRQIRIFSAARGQSVQAMLEQGLNLVLTQAKTEKN